MLLRKWAQALRRDGPPVGKHRQLPTARRDDLALDPDVVPEVDVRLPARERSLPQPVQRQHHLQVTGPVTERREAQLAADPREHHPPRNGHPLAGRRVGHELAEALPDLAGGRGAGEADGIGVDGLGEQPFALLAADALLLGQVVRRSRRGAGLVHALIHPGNRIGLSDPALAWLNSAGSPTSGRVGMINDAGEAGRLPALRRRRQLTLPPRSIPARPARPGRPNPARPKPAPVSRRTRRPRLRGHRG